MAKQIKFPFMEGNFRYRFKKVYVCDFEYATIGGELIPTSLAIKNINDPIQIAKKELELRKLPFIIRRPISNNNYEYWKLSDLVF